MILRKLKLRKNVYNMDVKERLRKFNQYKPYSEEIYEWAIDVTDYAKKFLVI